MLGAQYAIDNNQTVEEIEEQLDLLCDAIPTMGPSQSVFDCDKLANLPNITFDFSDAEFTLSPEQYMLRVRWSAPASCQLSCAAHTRRLARPSGRTAHARIETVYTCVFHATVCTTGSVTWLLQVCVV